MFQPILRISDLESHHRACIDQRTHGLMEFCKITESLSKQTKPTTKGLKPPTDLAEDPLRLPRQALLFDL